jgi:hypothetical protein
MTRSGSSSQTAVVLKRLRHQIKKTAGIARLPDMKHVRGIEGLKHLPKVRTRPAKLAAYARAMAKRMTPPIAREYKRRKFEPGFAGRLLAERMEFDRSLRYDWKNAIRIGGRRGRPRKTGRRPKPDPGET